MVYQSTELKIFMDRFISRASYFIDVDGNTQNLYSGEMISLLEECRSWSDMGLCKGYGNNLSMAAPYSYGGYPVSVQPAVALCTLPEEYNHNLGNYYFAPMPFDGNAVIAGGNERYPILQSHAPLYGVNAGSPDAEAAGDFLRFLLSEDGQYTMSFRDGTGDFNLPLNRAVFRNLVESDLERIQASISNTTDLDFPVLIKEAEEAVDQIAYTIIPKPYYNTIIREVAKQYFLGEISAEEAARQMSDKVDLYLKEQST
jgi:ABC-type glycerol-3-phosphate transport system substrate-binding protein